MPGLRLKNSHTQLQYERDENGYHEKISVTPTLRMRQWPWSAGSGGAETEHGGILLLIFAFRFSCILVLILFPLSTLLTSFLPIRRTRLLGFRTFSSFYRTFDHIDQRLVRLHVSNNRPDDLLIVRRFRDAGGKGRVISLAHKSMDVSKFGVSSIRGMFWTRSSFTRFLKALKRRWPTRCSRVYLCEIRALFSSRSDACHANKAV